MDDHRYALPAGYCLETYRVERVLGHGGFGITYLARDERLGRLVAIKEYMPADLAIREANSTVLPRSTVAQADYTWGLQRFLYEARTLAQFRHPNIAQVLTLFEGNGTAYIVMAYEQGRSLAEYLEECGGTLPTETLLDIAGPLLDGLEAVHKAGVLHRDIKPANIFLRADGTPVLLDFGTARQAVGSRTRSVASILTPGFAPIELYTTHGHQGPWTDIYGFGAVLYTCVSGSAPPEATARIEARMAGEPDPIEPAASVGRGCYPEALLQAIDWSLALLAKDRPQSIDELRDALMAGALPLSDRPAASTEDPGTGGETVSVRPDRLPPPPDDTPPAEQRASTGARPPDAPAPQPVGPPVPHKRPGRSIVGWVLAGGAAAALLAIGIWTADVLVGPPNHPPVAEASRTVTLRDRNTRVPLTIARPTDADRDPLRITVTQVPTRGTVWSGSQTVQSGQTLTLDALQSLTYSPAPGQTGNAGTFQYRVEDGRGGSATGTVAIEIQPADGRGLINRPPVVEARRTLEAPAQAGTMPLNILRPTDPDGDPLAITVTQVPQHGRILLAGSGGTVIQAGQSLPVEDLAALAYAPDPGQLGPAGVFSYRVDDGRGGTTFGWVEVTVRQPPQITCFSGQAEPQPGRVLRVPLDAGTVPLELWQPHTATGDALTIQVTQVPGAGTVLDGGRTVRIGDPLSLAQLGALAYRPAPDRDGEAGWFRYLASASNGARIESGVRIVVTSDGLPVDQLRTLEAGLSREEKRRVQQALHRLGHYSGAADGNFGERTATAIRAFQRTLAEPETGSLTTSQRDRLYESAASTAIGDDARQEVNWTQQERIRVQHGLELLRYDTGPRNGNFDAATRDAIRAFQASIAAPQTGYLSREQRLALAAAAAAVAAQRAEEMACRAQTAAARARAAAAVPDAFVRQYPDGATYRGEGRNEIRQGVGMQSWPDGRRYEGEWSSDTRSGVGISYASAYRNEGEWSGEELNGFVVQIRADGTRYAGEWAHGLADGYGVRTVPSSGARIAGEWGPVANSTTSNVNGYAVYVSDSGEQRGIWRDGKLRTRF